MCELNLLFVGVRRLRFAFCLSLMLLTTAGGALTARWSSRARAQEPVAAPGDSSTPTLPPPAAADNQTSAKMEVERLVVHRYGFEPAEITRPRGKFLLALDNRSGVADLELQLATESGSGAQRVRLSGGEKRWREFIELPPGRYLLTAAGHPQWQCRITLTTQ